MVPSPTRVDKVPCKRGVQTAPAKIVTKMPFKQAMRLSEIQPQPSNKV